MRASGGPGGARVTRLGQNDRLLVRLPSWLGDFVMAEPVVDALHRALEARRFATLSLVAPRRFFDLVEGRFPEARRLSKNDSWRGHDVALFLDGSLRSVTKAWRERIGQRCGWTSGGRAWLLTDGTRPALERGDVPLGLGMHGGGERRLPRPFGAAAAELCGRLGVAVVGRPPRLAATEVAREAVRARLAQLGLDPAAPYLVLDASARPESAKQAPAEQWRSVLAHLGGRGLPPVVVLAAPGEATVARAVAEGTGAALYDAPPPSLAELLAVIEGSAGLVGTDSGPRHLATATDRPQVILCGPTDPRHTADHTQRTTVLRRKVDCGPCHLERCPLTAHRTVRCLTELVPARIAEAAAAAFAV